MADVTPALEAAVYGVLEEALAGRDLRGLQPEESLAERGLLDSLTLMLIVERCEERFSVTIPDTEMIPDNFESVQAIARLMSRLQPR